LEELSLGYDILSISKTVPLYSCLFLAATKQLYKWAACLSGLFEDVPIVVSS